MIWAKTDAGRIEMQTRALVKERAQRNLLLVIDGIKTEEMLLQGLAGITMADFNALQAMGLIVPLAGSTRSVGASSKGAAGGTGQVATPASGSGSAAASAPAAEAVPLDYAAFTAALTQMISKELGLRGFVLTLAVEKAGTAEELRAVAEKTIAQIGERKGDAAAAAARRTLFGA